MFTTGRGPARGISAHPYVRRKRSRIRLLSGIPNAGAYAAFAADCASAAGGSGGCAVRAHAGPGAFGGEPFRTYNLSLFPGYPNLEFPNELMRVFHV